jgi:hypothetical protein
MTNDDSKMVLSDQELEVCKNLSEEVNLENFVGFSMMVKQPHHGLKVHVRAKMKTKKIQNSLPRLNVNRLFVYKFARLT